jgi:hypothetical protein
MGGNTAGTIWTVSGDALVKVDYSLPVTVADADPLVVPLAQAVLSGLRSGAPASVTLGPDYTSNVILGFAATAARGHGTRGRNATNVCRQTRVQVMTPRDFRR